MSNVKPLYRELPTHEYHKYDDRALAERLQSSELDLRNLRTVTEISFKQNWNRSSAFKDAHRHLVAAIDLLERDCACMRGEQQRRIAQAFNAKDFFRDIAAAQAAAFDAPFDGGDNEKV